MKIGIASVVIGIIGLVLITYFKDLANLRYQELDELGGVTFPVMSTTTTVTLFIGEVVGAVLGFMSYRRGKNKIGLLGMGICTLNLIFLYYPF